MLNDVQLSLLKKEIDRQLEIRCIKVTTELSLDKRKNGDLEFNLHSTFFQTVPVIHHDLNIINFGGGVYQDKENKNIINVFMPVHVAYFGNGEGLFTIEAKIRKDCNDCLFITKVSHL